MSDTITILLVDDDEEDYLITRDIIDDIAHRKYKLEWVGNYRDALNLIKEKRHDVYLIDYRLGGENGLDLISSAVKLGVKSPLILLTGQADIEIDERAMKAGAADYLVKGKITPYQLERSIRYSIQDVKNLEQIRKLNIELEERVQKRTKELAEAIRELEATNKKQKKAEQEVRRSLEKERELNELKSRFVTLASHEFRTPLSTILSSASLISRYQEKGDNDKVEKHISRIKSSVTNLTGILNDFLSLSKLEEGAIANKPSDFVLKDLIEEVMEELDSVVKPSQKLVFIGRHEDKLVVYDRGILKNVIINLLSNSIKYSDQGKIELKTITTEDGLDITISDEGIGIPIEDQQFIFSRFFRANNSGNIPGTGLGLNIVKKYVELLKGNIRFESMPGKGTTFFIKLPS